MERTPLSEGTRIYRTVGAWIKAGSCQARFGVAIEDGASAASLHQHQHARSGVWEPAGRRAPAHNRSLRDRRPDLRLMTFNNESAELNIHRIERLPR